MRAQRRGRIYACDSARSGRCEADAATRPRRTGPLRPSNDRARRFFWRGVLAPAVEAFAAGGRARSIQEAQNDRRQAGVS